MNNLHPLKFLTLAATLATALLLAACNDKKSVAASHNHDAPGNAAHDKHDDHGSTGEKITHFTGKTELYVEFPALVAGQPSVFVAHFTSLTDFKPITKGRLTLILAGGAPEERFTADAPETPGIYKVAVTPKAAGERALTLAIESDQGIVTHKLGHIEVYVDAKASQAGHGKHETRSHEQKGESITFTKEQQWKVDFATAEVAMGTARPSVAATATIKAHPDGEAQLAAPVAGILNTAGGFPHVGQRVKKGQVLAWLAPRLGGDADQATLETNASKAMIALDQARRERERMESLFREEAISEKRLLEARASESMIEKEAMAAQSRKDQLGGTGGIAIRAPLDGVIADAAAAPGAFVAEGAPLFHVANAGRLWLVARIPESEIGRLGTPSGASFTVDSFAKPIVIEPGKNGKLIAMGSVVDAVTRTVPVVFEFNNPDNTLRLGMTARTWLYGGAGQEALLVPASAVQDESGAQVVYMQTGGESFERRIVRPGVRDGERIAILDGLEPGQRVVSKGAYLIRLSLSKTGPTGHAH